MPFNAKSKPQPFSRGKRLIALCGSRISKAIQASSRLPTPTPSPAPSNAPTPEKWFSDLFDGNTDTASKPALSHQSGDDEGRRDCKGQDKPEAKRRLTFGLEMGTSSKPNSSVAAKNSLEPSKFNGSGSCAAPHTTSISVSDQNNNRGDGLSVDGMVSCTSAKRQLLFGLSKTKPSVTLKSATNFSVLTLNIDANGSKTKNNESSASQEKSCISTTGGDNFESAESIRNDSFAGQVNDNNVQGSIATIGTEEERRPEVQQNPIQSDPACNIKDAAIDFDAAFGVGDSWTSLTFDLDVISSEEVPRNESTTIPETSHTISHVNRNLDADTQNNEDLSQDLAQSILSQEAVPTLPQIAASSSPQHTAPGSPEVAVPGTPQDTTPNSADGVNTKPRGRKRVADPSTWQRNISKKAKNLGEAYVSPKNKEERKAAEMRPPCVCNKNCRFKLTDDERKEIFRSFWQIGDHTRHWDYITRNTNNTPVKKRTSPGQQSRRNFSRKYFLETFKDGKKDKVSVCKKMFINTLGIWDGWISSAHSHVQSGSGSLSPDKRGRHPNRPRGTTEEQKQTIRKHINLYPKIPAHYVRARSKREYFESNLSIQKMFKQYKEWCNEESIPAKSRATNRMYRNVLNSEFNIRFFKPKKDQCQLCNQMRNGTRPEREAKKEKWVKHLSNKKAARKEKEEAKNLGVQNPNVHVCVFDLQKVLPCPKSESSVFFYKNKLSVFNFTVFDMVMHQATCYVWHEGTAKQGANEISSCFLNYVESCVEKGATVIRSFSDSCSGQNKNRYFFCMLLIAAAVFSVQVKHCFLEPGHTQNEGDSVHARIELSSKAKEIFDMDEWIDVIKSAKETQPAYEVKQVNQKKVYDLHPLVDEKQHWERDNKGNKISWSKVRIVEADPNKLGVLTFKYDYDGEAFTVNTQQRRGHPVNLKTYKLPLAYNGRIPLKKKKVEHLKSLCKDLHIPSRYHQKYDNYLSNVDPVDEEEVHLDDEPAADPDDPDNPEIADAEVQRNGTVEHDDDENSEDDEG